MKENDADIMDPEETATVAVPNDRDTQEQSEPGNTTPYCAVVRTNNDQRQQPLIDLSKYDLTNLTITDRDQITLELYEAYPDRTHAQMRIDFLNQNGILFKGNPLDRKTAHGSTMQG